MRSRSPSKRRGNGARGRSPPRRGHGGGKGKGSVSLLVTNLPLSCRPEHVRVPFQRFGPVRDVYLPRDYHSGEPRGFAFVEFADSSDASEAKYHMNRKMLSGREITVVFAAEKRKKPEEMRIRTGARPYSDNKGHRSCRYGQSQSCSYSRSRSPRRRGCARSRSFSPAPKKRDHRSASPQKKDEGQTKSPVQCKEHDEKRRSFTPEYNDRLYADIACDETPLAPSGEGSWVLGRSPQTSSPGRSLCHSFSRSRSPQHTGRARPRSGSPAPRRRDQHSASPQRKDEELTKSPGAQGKGHDEKRRSYTPEYNHLQHADIVCDETPPAHSGEGSLALGRSPQTSSPGRSRCHSFSCPRSPQHTARARSWSCSPAPRRQDHHSASPQRKEEQLTKSPGTQAKGHDDKRRSYTPEYNDRRYADNCNSETPPAPDGERSWVLGRSPRTSSPGRSRSHSYSRSRSPRHCGRARSRSRSPDPRRLGHHPASPQRREEHRSKSSGQALEYDEKRRSCTPEYNGDNDHVETPPAAGNGGRRAWALGKYSPPPPPPPPPPVKT